MHGSKTQFMHETFMCILSLQVIFCVSPLSQGSPVPLWSRCGEGCAGGRRGIWKTGVTASYLLPAQTTESEMFERVRQQFLVVLPFNSINKIILGL